MVEEEPKLAELLATIHDRLRDALKDVEVAIRCLELHKYEPTAKMCILEYLKTGKTPKPE